MNAREIADTQRRFHTLVAGAAPVQPPSDWFDMEEPDALTPLTVTDAGHVYGHVAPWEACHTGFPGTCKTPPRSPSGYAYFHVGETVTADGRRVATGRYTVSGGHASLTASRAETVKHYDDTGTAAADIVARDGRYGIFVTGALRPGVSEDQLRVMRASPPSGDWRGVNGALELVGLLAVNVPGYPVPRSMVASGVDETEVTALIASYCASDMSDDKAQRKTRIKALRGQGGLAALTDYGLKVGQTPTKRRMSMTAATFSTEQRDKLAGKALAMPDGIRNVGDLHNAIQAVGRAKDQQAARAWIIRRARELGATDLIPPGWTHLTEMDMRERKTRAAQKAADATDGDPAAVMAAGFDEAAHPRAPAGSPTGGEFVRNISEATFQRERAASAAYKAGEPTHTVIVTKSGPLREWSRRESTTYVTKEAAGEHAHNARAMGHEAVVHTGTDAPIDLASDQDIFAAADRERAAQLMSRPASSVAQGHVLRPMVHPAGNYPATQGGHPHGYGLGPDYKIRTAAEPGAAPKVGLIERLRDMRLGRHGVHH